MSQGSTVTVWVVLANVDIFLAFYTSCC